MAGSLLDKRLYQMFGLGVEVGNSFMNNKTSPSQLCPLSRNNTDYLILPSPPRLSYFHHQTLRHQGKTPQYPPVLIFPTLNFSPEPHHRTSQTTTTTKFFSNTNPPPPTMPTKPRHTKADLEEIVEDLKDTRRDLNSQLKTVKAERKALKAALQEAEAINQVLDDENREYKAEVWTLENELEGTQEECVMMEHEMRGLREENDVLREMNMGLEVMLTALKGIIRDMGGKVDVEGNVDVEEVDDEEGGVEVQMEADEIEMRKMEMENMEADKEETDKEETDKEETNKETSKKKTEKKKLVERDPALSVDDIIMLASPQLEGSEAPTV
ncbi:hypothetical protein EJ04DRAFT_524151 [Polyplosphaeria fusca]|uniref:Uncharacterized protein n=1 Tax=Polyplosphaeria fusca TaxID=682080 RepID=A0A9P4QWR2_9PLEO|nr:hypothetical protein EJ04DRAFT_524151 [Polyplosphaeria fusca]